MASGSNLSQPSPPRNPSKIHEILEFVPVFEFILSHPRAQLTYPDHPDLGTDHTDPPGSFGSWPGSTGYLCRNCTFCSFCPQPPITTRENLIHRGIAVALVKTKRYCYLVVALVTKARYNYSCSSSVSAQKSATTIIPTLLWVG